jgi:hypothetical protein
VAVDERPRHQLSRKLQEVLGPEEATTLMEHLPAGGVGRLATRDDLAAVRDELEGRIDGVEQCLLTEIHRTARNLTLSLTTIMAVLNGIVFTALKLA